MRMLAGIAGQVHIAIQWHDKVVRARVTMETVFSATAVVVTMTIVKLFFFPLPVVPQVYDKSMPPSHGEDTQLRHWTVKNRLPLYSQETAED